MSVFCIFAYPLFRNFFLNLVHLFHHENSMQIVELIGEDGKTGEGRWLMHYLNFRQTHSAVLRDT